MSKKITVIHPGTMTRTVPARTELVEVPDPKGPEGAVKLEEQVVEEAYEQEITVPHGTRFGQYLINVPYEVDSETAKNLKRRGFVQVNKGEAAEIEEEAAANSPEALNAAVAEEDRVRAQENLAGFDPTAAAASEEGAAKKSKRGDK